MSGGTAIGWIREVVLDCPDPWALSFQATATPLAEDTARVHFDIWVEDLEAAHARVIFAGATPIGQHVSPRPARDGEPVPWRVYRDLAGHAFCLVVR